MKSTSADATSIHAVFAPSSFGGSAASTSGACSASATHNQSFCKTERRDGMLCFLPNESITASRKNVVCPCLGEVFGVEGEGAAAAVGEPVLERGRDGAESDLRPGDAGFVEERDLERLLAGLEVEAVEARQV